MKINCHSKKTKPKFSIVTANIIAASLNITHLSFFFLLFGVCFLLERNLCLISDRMFVCLFNYGNAKQLFLSKSFHACILPYMLFKTSFLSFQLQITTMGIYSW